jgi:hypothetical protein
VGQIKLPKWAKYSCQTQQANVEGQRENFPTISLHGLKILVVDAFGGKHVASLQPDAAVTPIPTR